MQNLRRIRKSILPILLALLGAISLTGCIYIPLFKEKIDDEHYKGRNLVDFRNLVGSNKIELGMKRQQVYKLLGEPTMIFTKNQPSHVEYSIRTYNILSWAPICGFGHEGLTYYRLQLYFDMDDVLIKWESYRNGELTSMQSLTEKHDDHTTQYLIPE
jgi:outer membrane protein assembly factor BamE (lipoprotein component of BamABCDE complex)